MLIKLYMLDWEAEILCAVCALYRMYKDRGQEECVDDKMRRMSDIAKQQCIGKPELGKHLKVFKMFKFLFGCVKLH